MSVSPLAPGAREELRAELLPIHGASGVPHDHCGRAIVEIANHLIIGRVGRSNSARRSSGRHKALRLIPELALRGIEVNQVRACRLYLQTWGEEVSRHVMTRKLQRAVTAPGIRGHRIGRTIVARGLRLIASPMASYQENYRSHNADDHRDPPAPGEKHHTESYMQSGRA